MTKAIDRAAIEVRSVHQLCSLADREFVRAAYRTVLNREADPVGEQQFTQQLRGGMAKTQILYALHLSVEARAVPVTLPGLRRKVNMVRLFSSPLFVRLGIPRSGQYSNSASARASRRLENDVARLHEDNELAATAAARLSELIERMNNRLRILEAGGVNTRRRKVYVSVEQILDQFQ